MKILDIKVASQLLILRMLGRNDEPVPLYINIPVSLALFVKVDSLGTTLCFM